VIISTVSFAPHVEFECQDLETCIRRFRCSRFIEHARRWFDHCDRAARSKLSSGDQTKITEEMKRDADAVQRLWFRRLQCVVEARHQPAFSAQLTRCLADGSAKKG
jgi:hypothetical protein